MACAIVENEGFLHLFVIIQNIPFKFEATIICPGPFGQRPMSIIQRILCRLLNVGSHEIQSECDNTECMAHGDDVERTIDNWWKTRTR